MLDYLVGQQAHKVSAKGATLGLRMSANSTIEATDPPWLAALGETINQLICLPQNWDGEGGLPVPFDAAMALLSFLLSNLVHEMPAPTATPLSRGGVALEWHLMGRTLELYFGESEPAAYFYADENGQESEGEIAPELLVVKSLLGKLASNGKRRVSR